jgi:hypothetical protein
MMSKLKVGLILGIVIVLTLAVVASGCKTSPEAVENIFQELVSGSSREAQRDVRLPVWYTKEL